MENDGLLPAMGKFVQLFNSKLHFGVSTIRNIFLRTTLKY